jgi:precorrin-6B methylase 2
MWSACTLHAAVKLNIFDAIGDRKALLEDVARKTKTSKHGMGMLLNAVAALGLIKKTNGLYQNTKVSREFLCEHSKKYLGYSILHHHHLMKSWIKLDRAVITGKRVRSRMSRLRQGSGGQARSSQPRLKAFYQAMNTTGSRVAPLVVKRLNIKNAKSLIDIGGGPATYACHFCLQNPQLKAVVFDLHTARPHAFQTIKRFAMQRRVRFVEGNILKNRIPGQYDVAFLSHILHAESPGHCALVIKKAVSALSPGGKIFIQEFVMNNKKDGPLFPSLFALNMLLGSDGGTAYSEKELCDMLKKVGCQNVRHLNFVMPNGASVVCGEVPKC